MQRWVTSTLFVLVIFPMTAMAHGPTRQKVEEKITIAAPPDKVWAVVADFGGLHKWHAAIKATAMDGEKKRVVTLNAEGDPTITEELKDQDDTKMTVKYKILNQDTVKKVDFPGATYDVPAVPVDNYLAVITVTPAAGGSEVTWTGKFYRVYKLSYYTDEPRYPEGLGDQEAVETIAGFYKGGLENLKKIVEGG